jgi:hypothetical protein
VHAASGFTLTPLGEPQRQLGVPLCADPRRAAATAFHNSAGKLIGSAAKWAAVPLSLEGRAHVAKQCQASKLVFQASHLPAPPAQLDAAQRVVRRFVALGTATAEEAAQHRQPMPAEHVLALLKPLGGMGHAILRHAAHSLMAKHVAALFGHGWQLWKRFLRDELAGADDQASLPTWAVTLAPAPPAARGAMLARLGPRVRAYVEAFATVGPRRAPCLPAGQRAWVFFSVMAEPLFHNAQVTLQEDGQAGGGPAGPRRLLRPEDLPPCARPQQGAPGGWRHLRDVRAAMRGGQARGDVAAAVEVVLAAVPPEWRAQLERQLEPAPDWWCVAAGDGRRYAWPRPRPGEPGPGEVGFAAASLMQADALGRLVPIVPAALHDMPEEELPEDAGALLLAAEAAVAAAGAAWRPAAVVPRPTPRPRWTLTDLELQEPPRS